MPGESFRPHPHEAVENADGDIVPFADLMYEPDADDTKDDTTEIRAAAARIVEAPAPDVSPVELAYDRAVALVERDEDRGLDSAAAWERVDPTGSIRRDFQQYEAEKTARKGADAIRQAAHDRTVAGIEKIHDLDARRRALSQLTALERASGERRGRRW